MGGQDVCCGYSRELFVISVGIKMTSNHIIMLLPGLCTVYGLVYWFGCTIGRLRILRYVSSTTTHSYSHVYISTQRI